MPNPRWIPHLLFSFAVAACHAPAAQVAPASTEVAGSPITDSTCAPPLRSCVLCDGHTTVCATRCPECAPPEAPPDEVPTVAERTTSEAGASSELVAGR